MIKVIRFLGKVILVFADIFKTISNVLKFMIVIGIVLGVFILTMIATAEAIHFIQPVEYATQYGVPVDIFKTDFWAWIVAILGWTTMGYGFAKMFAAENAANKKQDEQRKSNTWLG